MGAPPARGQMGEGGGEGGKERGEQTCSIQSYTEDAEEA